MSSEQTLRLIWPQWQGAGARDVRALVPELPFDIARRGYAVGTAVLGALLPEATGPVATVPVAMDDDGLAERDGVEAKDVVLSQLGAALDLIAAHDPARILTVGGECSVSVAPFAALAARHDDLAVLWIDAHPDVGLPTSEYHGHHAMAVSLLTGHGDPDLLGRLPATVDPSRVALVGLHEWAEDDIGHVAEWGITSFGPDDVRASARPLLDWLAATGCSRVAVHLDVDVVDSDEVVFGLGAVPGGLRGAEVNRLVGEIAAVHDVVGLTIAEYVPRQALRLREVLRGLPLL